MPLAVATLSESNPAAIGMRTLRQRASTSSGSPWPSEPKQNGDPLGTGKLGERCRAGGAERDRLEAVRGEQRQSVVALPRGARRERPARRRPRPGSPSDRADRNRRRRGARRRRRRRRHCGRCRRHCRDWQSRRGRRRAPRPSRRAAPRHSSPAAPPERQDAAVHGEADDAVEDFLACREHRHLGGQLCDQRLERGEALLRDEQRDGPLRRAVDEDAEHHLALRHEQALPAGKVALANVEIGGDARVVRVVDRENCWQALARPSPPVAALAHDGAMPGAAP